MRDSDKILECVPNVSYGRGDHQLIRMADAIRSVNGQKLLDIDNSVSANRTVFSFAGQPEAVVDAAFQLIKTASEIIDMRTHHGGHPRIGATDVCPLVGLRNITRDEAIQHTLELARRVGNHLGIPVYLYEYSAKKSYRRSLPQIRRGQYEGLPGKMVEQKWQPDFGPAFIDVHRESILKTGATVIGVRHILVAFNVSLSTASVDIATKIAYRIRSSGWPKALQMEAQGARLYAFQELRSIGWYSEDYHCAQVSCNFLKHTTTRPLEVWERIKQLAQEYGCEATGCEVIGLIPEVCILEAGYYAARLSKPHPNGYSRDDLIKMGVAHFKFNAVRPFNYHQKILEYRLQEL